MVSQIVHSANNIVAYLAYAAGFAAGNFVGMYIEDRLALGTLIIRVFVQNHAARTGRQPARCWLWRDDCGRSRLKRNSAIGIYDRQSAAIWQKYWRSFTRHIHMPSCPSKTCAPPRKAFFREAPRLNDRGLFGRKSK